MRKSARAGMVLILVALVAVAMTWSSIKLRFTESATYRENDTREYQYFTPEILKNMPRISDRYEFDYALIDGTPRSVNAVKFYGASDATKIIDYLKSLGYLKHSECRSNNECWKGGDPQETIYVGRIASETGVIVVVEHSFNGQNNS